MARHSVAIAVAGTLGLVLAASLAPLLARVGQVPMLASDWAALRFTVEQALWSAALSCVFGALLARALFRRQFWGKALLIRLISAPFLLPSLAAVMGLLLVFGRGGAVNAALAALGLLNFSIYGFGGVVLAHVFLNLPLATRMVLHGWQGIPAERFRLAQSLQFGPRGLFWHIEWPMLRAILPSAMAAIFLVCLSSFAVALVLGGGPRASTLELSMYQSLRFQFDLDRAAQLALWQVAVASVAVVLSALVWRPLPFGAGLDRSGPLRGSKGAVLWADGAVISGAALFFALPLGAIVVMGAGQIYRLPAGLWHASLLSLGISLAASALATAGALVLAWARARGAGLWVECVAMAPLGVSSLALGTGAYMALSPVTAPQIFAVPIAVIFGAALALPFAYRLLHPACRDVVVNFSRLSAQVGLSPWAQVWLVVVPRLSRQIGFCLGLAAALSMGDFGVLALFGGPEHTSLPILITRLMGSYQMDAAAAVTLWLMLLSFSLFWLFDRWGALRAKA